MAGMTKVESYLVELGIAYQEASSGTFIVDDAAKGLLGISIAIDEPIVVLRARVMAVPAAKRAELFERLLRLNATDMLHGAYGVDGSDIVLIDTLEYGTMDREEFEAALDSIGLALSRHYGVLGVYRD